MHFRTFHHELSSIISTFYVMHASHTLLENGMLTSGLSTTVSQAGINKKARYMRGTGMDL